MTCDAIIIFMASQIYSTDEITELLRNGDDHSLSLVFAELNNQNLLTPDQLLILAGQTSEWARLVRDRNAACVQMNSVVTAPLPDRPFDPDIDVEHSDDPKPYKREVNHPVAQRINRLIDAIEEGDLEAVEALAETFRSGKYESPYFNEQVARLQGLPADVTAPLRGTLEQHLSGPDPQHRVFEVDRSAP